MTKTGVIAGLALLVLLLCIRAMIPRMSLTATGGKPAVAFRLVQKGNNSSLFSISVWDQSGQYLWVAKFFAGDGRKEREAKVTKFSYGTVPAGMRQILPDNCQRPRALVPGDTLFIEVDHFCDNVFPPTPVYGGRQFVFTMRNDSLVRINYPSGRLVVPKEYPIQKRIHVPNSQTCP